MSSALSQDELKARKLVWEALSEFWLDTELQDLEWNRIARVIAESPYSIEEVMDIHRNEVAPVVSSNVLSVAGEWVGFDEEWLGSQCHAQVRRRGSFIHRLHVWLLTRRLRFFTDHHWREVIPRVQALRKQ